MRDHPAFALNKQTELSPPSPSAGLAMNGVHGHDLRDSLWFFDGHDMRVWIDVQDVLSSASAELGREVPAPVKIPVDFYPLSTLINKAIIFGIEPELIQRRDTSFAFLRFSTRVCSPAPTRESWACLHRSVADMVYRPTFFFPHCCVFILHNITTLQHCT